MGEDCSAPIPYILPIPVFIFRSQPFEQGLGIFRKGKPIPFANGFEVHFEVRDTTFHASHACQQSAEPSVARHIDGWKQPFVSSQAAQLQDMPDVSLLVVGRKYEYTFRYLWKNCVNFSSTYPLLIPLIDKIHYYFYHHVLLLGAALGNILMLECTTYDLYQLA